MVRNYAARWRRKFRRYVAKGDGILAAAAKTCGYACRDAANVALLALGLAVNSLFSAKCPEKKILFVEPPQQGFGDLLFQTATFRALALHGYAVHVLLSKPEHAAILRGNPDVSSVNIKLPPRWHGWVVALGRDTLREHAVALRFPCARRAYPDADIATWREALAGNHAHAWISSVGAALGVDLGRNARPTMAAGAELLPQRTVAVVAGIGDPQKRVGGLRDVTLAIAESRPVIVLGTEVGWARIEHPNVDDRVNQQTYAGAIDTLAGCAAAVAPEGSLAHVALTLGVPTVVVERDEPYDRFGPTSPLATRAAAADLAAAGGAERVAAMVAAVAR